MMRLSRRRENAMDANDFSPRFRESQATARVDGRAVFNIGQRKLLERIQRPASVPRTRFRVDILPKRKHAEVICLPKKPKIAWNFCKALWIC
jgi:hypothetical protein